MEEIKILDAALGRGLNSNSINILKTEIETFLKQMETTNPKLHKAMLQVVESLGANPDSWKNVTPKEVVQRLKSCVTEYGIVLITYC